MISGSSASGSAKAKRTDRSPVCSTLATFSQAFRYLGSPCSASVCIDQITSSTVTGLPSEKRASGRSVNSTHSRSGPVSTNSASRP